MIKLKTNSRILGNNNYPYGKPAVEVEKVLIDGDNLLLFTSDGKTVETNLTNEGGGGSGEVTLDMLNKKVDKVTGKSLISDTEITRLSKVKNYDDTSIKSDISKKANQEEVDSKISSLTNRLESKADKTEVSIKANQSDVDEQINIINSTTSKLRTDVDYCGQRIDEDLENTTRALAGKVDWDMSKKIIVLPNGGKLSGTLEDGDGAVLAQINEWGVTDLGSSKLPTTINSSERPKVQLPGQTGDTAEKIAFLSDITESDSYTKSEADEKFSLKSDVYTKEEVDSKVTSNVEIIDNLTEGGSDKALSAEQGKVLDTKITEVRELITPHVNAYTKSEADAKFSTIESLNATYDKITEEISRAKQAEESIKSESNQLVENLKGEVIKNEEVVSRALTEHNDKINGLVDTKVDKVDGKVLIDQTDINKLSAIESNAQVNKIEGIKINGVGAEINSSDKSVDLHLISNEINLSAKLFLEDLTSESELSEYTNIMLDGVQTPKSSCDSASGPYLVFIVKDIINSTDDNEITSVYASSLKSIISDKYVLKSDYDTKISSIESRLLSLENP